MRTDIEQGQPIILTKDHPRGLSFGGPIPAGTKGRMSTQAHGWSPKLGRPHSIVVLYNVTIVDHIGTRKVKEKEYYVEDDAFSVDTYDFACNACDAGVHSNLLETLRT